MAEKNHNSMSSSLILAINAGSSSLKASLIDTNNSAHVLTVLVEQLKTPDSKITLLFDTAYQIHNNTPFQQKIYPNMGHEEALARTMQAIRDVDNTLMSRIGAVGHRVVHGGTKFAESTLIDDTTLEAIEDVSHLAPLHNPHNVSCIKLAKSFIPDVPHVAVFDTAFHSTIPERAYTYPLPKEYRQQGGMRKFGFHGTSVKYVSEKAAAILKEQLHPKRSKKEDFDMIVCHIGSGASVTAVSALKSRDTSMGFTPLAGLMMSTRCGDLDPSLVSVAYHSLNKNVDMVMDDFNTKSGLKGMMDGEDYDMRSLLRRQHNDHKAKLAVDMFVYRLAQHVASAIVALDGDSLDAIVFTAGIGEHSAEIRQRTLQHLRLVLRSDTLLDDERNSLDGRESNGVISKEGSWPVILDIPTDEEVMIAMECTRKIA